MPTTVQKTKVRGRTVESNSPADSPRKQQKPSAAPAAKQSGKTPSLSDAISNIDKLKAAAAKQGGVSAEKLTKLSARQQTALARGEGFRMLAIDLLGRSPFNRDKFDATAEEQMKESVREKGIIQPLTVRRNPKYRAIELNGVWRVTTLEGTPVGDPLPQSEAQYTAVQLNRPEYEIIAGERRWRAATALHMSEVPVLVRSSSDREALEVQAVENLQREDLNPIDEALKYRQLIEVYKAEGILATEALEMVRENLNVSKSLVYERLRLLDLPPETIAATHSGRLPGSQAGLIAKIDDRDLQEEVTKRVLNPDDHDLPDDDDAPQGETLVSRMTVMSVRATNQLVNEAIKVCANRREYEKVKAEFEKAGREILPPEVNTDLFPYNNVHIEDDQPYVAADQRCDQDRNWRPWKVALGKSAPAEILAQGKRGQPVIVYDRKLATAAIKKKAGTSSSASRSSKSPSQRAEEQAQKQRMKIFNSLLEESALAGEATEGPELWRFIFECICHFGGHDALHRVYKRRELPKPEQKYHETRDFIAHFEKANGRELRGVIVELLVSRYAPYAHGSGWNENLVKACKTFDIDLPSYDVQTSGKEDQI